MMVNINCHQKIIVRGRCARKPGKGTLTITEANGDISDRNRWNVRVTAQCFQIAANAQRISLATGLRINIGKARSSQYWAHGRQHVLQMFNRFAPIFVAAGDEAQLILGKREVRMRRAR